MAIHLVDMTSDIVEDSCEEGEGNSTGCGYAGQPLGRTFPTIPAAIQHLASYYGLPANEADYTIEEGLLQTSRMVADHTEAQNGGWMEPTSEEMSAWRAGHLKLYSENYDIRFLRCA